jgi:DNA-binding transcriptional LysR family regulator
MPITTDEVQVFVPIGHRLHVQTTVTPSDLRTERFIMPKVTCEFMEMAGLEPGKGGTRIRYQAGDGRTILAMVREGLGITLLPRTMLPEKLEGVVAVPLDPPQRLQIGLGVKSQKTASPGAKLFVQTALAWVSEA